MDLQLAGQRALVFGSSSGLGRELARVLAAEGARVVVTSREVERGESAKNYAAAEGFVVGDLSIEGDAARMVGQAAEQLGGLDICVLNTGGAKPGGIMATNGFDDVAYHAFLRPVLEASRAVAPHLLSGRHARLIALTARSVVEATPDLALSSVFRSGVAAAMRSLALELAPKVNVNVVVTGQFDTPALDRFEAAKAAAENKTAEQVRREHVEAIPVGRVGTAEEFADVVAFLCSPRTSFVTGSLVRIDGGAVHGF
jgi:NAD(P)-dependent dehydrogenase (short-subunit alcohol dehydrogenase family)